MCQAELVASVVREIGFKGVDIAYNMQVASVVCFLPNRWKPEDWKLHCHPLQRPTCSPVENQRHWQLVFRRRFSGKEITGTGNQAEGIQEGAEKCGSHRG